jgi:hypothetical protein
MERLSDEDLRKAWQELRSAMEYRGHDRDACTSVLELTLAGRRRVEVISRVDPGDGEVCSGSQSVELSSPNPSVFLPGIPLEPQSVSELALAPILDLGQGFRSQGLEVGFSYSNFSSLWLACDGVNEGTWRHQLSEAEWSDLESQLMEGTFAMYRHFLDAALAQMKAGKGREQWWGQRWTEREKKQWPGEWAEVELKRRPVEWSDLMKEICARVKARGEFLECLLPPKT